MAESVYRVTEVVGVSADSWEQATKNAVETVSQSVRELRIGEVVRQDVTIEDGKSPASASVSGSRSSTTRSRNRPPPCGGYMSSARDQPALRGARRYSHRLEGQAFDCTQGGGRWRTEYLGEGLTATYVDLSGCQVVMP